MEAVLAILTGVLVATSVFLMLDRSLIRYLFGLVFLGNAANLAIFTVGGVVRGAPALIPPGAERPPADVAAALPQAMILTAIVISFGLLAFAFAMAVRAHERLGTIDTDAMDAAEGDGGVAGDDGGGDRDDETGDGDTRRERRRP